MLTLRNDMQWRMAQLAQMGQPKIDIQLKTGDDGSDNSYVMSYSTMDTIEGQVIITAPTCTKFHGIEISFTGVANVFVERLTTTPSMSGRSEASHSFLVLKQPLTLPPDRVLAAGEKYLFPFTFTVPTQLLPRACPHKVASDSVRQAHLMLPPSLGDASLSGFGATLLDDIAPEMSKILYGIRVRILQKREGEEKLSMLVEKTRKLRVKPAFEEQPPLKMDGNGDFRPRQEKPIKRGLFKGRLGTLVAETIQPKALVIPGARTTENDVIASRAEVVLRFDPISPNDLPPRLGSLKTNLKVSTFYASCARSHFPVRSEMGYDVTQGAYAETLTLSSMCIASAGWEKHPASANPIPRTGHDRRDSGVSSQTDTSTPGIPSASKNYHLGSPFYTASILVPITLPKTKSFIPTFHSCLISRTYTLLLSLSVHTSGMSDPSLTLKVPIQVCAEGSAAGNANAQARTAEAGALEEMEGMFTPRSVAPPSEWSMAALRASLDAIPVRNLARGHDAPPEYTAFAPFGGRSRERYTFVV